MTTFGTNLLGMLIPNPDASSGLNMGVKRLTAMKHPGKWRWFGSDDFPFQSGDFLWFHVNFPGCKQILS